MQFTELETQGVELLHEWFTNRRTAGCFPKTAVLEALEIEAEEYATLMQRLDELGVVEIRSTPGDFGVLFVINPAIKELQERIENAASQREFIKTLVDDTLQDVSAGGSSGAAVSAAPNWFSENPGLTKALVALVAAAAAVSLLENLLSLLERARG